MIQFLYLPTHFHRTIRFYSCERPFGAGFLDVTILKLSATEFWKRILDFCTDDKAIFFYEFIFVKTEAQDDEI